MAGWLAGWLAGTVVGHPVDLLILFSVDFYITKWRRTVSPKQGIFGG
jgi:hypothetical protein